MEEKRKPIPSLYTKIHIGDKPFKVLSHSYYAFEVLDGGVWYKIDASHLSDQLYEGEDLKRVVRKAREAVVEYGKGLRHGYITGKPDPTPHYEAALNTVFEEVVFLGTDCKPGVVY